MTEEILAYNLTASTECWICLIVMSYGTIIG